MTCDVARDLLFDEQEGFLNDDERATLHAHLQSCAACRSEEAALAETYAALASGVRAMAASVLPSPDFWQRLGAGLDAIDRETNRAGALKEPRRPVTWLGRRRRRWIGAVALLVALLTGAIASGAPQQAWAMLRQLFHTVPFIGTDLGQIPAAALVSTGPAASTNGSLTLTVTGLVSGHHVTLVSYRLSGRTLAGTGAGLPVADALDAILVGEHGRRYLPTYWLPVQTGLRKGVPELSGALAFDGLASGERLVRLEARQLPFTSRQSRPWSVPLALRPAAAGAAQTSLPVNSGQIHDSIRVAVTDVTFTPRSTVVDLAASVTGGPYAGGRVVSLSPELASGAFAPRLSGSRTGSLAANLSPLPMALRAAVLPRPEFVYPAVTGGYGRLRMVLPAVGIMQQDAVTLSVRPGMPARTLTLGTARLTVARAVVETAPAALGLGGQKRLRLILGFSLASAGGALRSVSVVIDGVSQTVSRDDPSVVTPLAAGQREIRIAVENPLITINGPWVIPIMVQGH